MADAIGVQVIVIKSNQITGFNIPLFFCHFLLFLLTLCFLPTTVY